MNRHKRPTDVWRQLESRHAPETIGETSTLLKKYEQYKIAATSGPMLDIAALSDIRAQLSVREIAITDQGFCVRVLDSLPREYEHEVRHFQFALTPTTLDRVEQVVRKRFVPRHRRN